MVNKDININIKTTADVTALTNVKKQLAELAAINKRRAAEFAQSGLIKRDLLLKGLTGGEINKAKLNLKELGLSMNENGAIIDDYTKSVLPASSATRMMIQQAGGLGQMMKKVSLETKAGRTAMKSFNDNLDAIGVTGFRARQAQALFARDVDLGNIKIRKGGKVADGYTGSIRSMNRVTKEYVRSSAKPFRGEFLSLMFIGMGLQQVFGGLINSVLQMTGIFDAFRGILASILLPILMPLIAKWLPWLIEKLKDPAFKDFIGRMIIFLAVIGAVMAIIFPFALLFSTLGIKLKDVIVFFKSLNPFVEGAGAVWLKLLGIFAILIGVFEIFTGVIKDQLWPVLKGFLFIAGGILLIIGGIPAIIGGAIIALVALADKFNIVRGIVLAAALPLTIVLDLLRGIGEALKGNFNFDFRLTKQTFGGMIDAFKNPFGKPTEGIGSLFSTPVTAPAVENKEPLGSMLGGTETINYQPDINVTMAQNGMNADEISKLINSSLYSDISRRGVGA